MAPVSFAGFPQAQNSGWRVRSQQAYFTRHERAVAKGFYKPKPLKEAAVQGDKNWNTFKEHDKDKISKRWADVTDLPVGGDLVPNSFDEVYDECVDAIVDLCPPPPPRELPPLESGAVSQLIECQNSTIAVLSASLQSFCVQSAGGCAGSAISQADLRDLYGRCQIYIQDSFGKAAISMGDEC